jgi:hypothetical protein
MIPTRYRTSRPGQTHKYEKGDTLASTEATQAACAGKEHSNRERHLPLLQVFLFLQVLDFLTTILVLKRGGYEANPLVEHLMLLGPISGLFAAKMLVVAIGAAVLWYQRHRVVFIANSLYAAVVCWNLLALITVA